MLDGLRWEVALLQEAPPRWLEPLGRRCRANGALALTSRNELAFLRAAIADRFPDLIKSNEGGSNMLLVRAPGTIEAVERHMLARTPERRTLLLARVVDARRPAAHGREHAPVGALDPPGRGGAARARQSWRWSSPAPTR